MEWLESLLPLLLLLIYFMAQVRKRGAKPPPVAGEAHEVEPPRKRTPFEEIIRQIQEAAADAQADRQGVVPETTTVFAGAPPPSMPPPARSADTSEFHGLGGFDHETHGFGAVNPFSEESFEMQAPSPPPPAHERGHLDYSPHSTLGDVAEVSGRGRKRHPLVARLRTADGLRNAFIMKEILDRPVSRRR